MNTTFYNFEIAVKRSTMHYYPDYEKLTWFAMMRAALLFQIYPLLSPQFKELYSVFGKGGTVKDFKLGAEMEASLALAVNPNLIEFNTALFKALNQDSHGNVALHSANLPKCSLEVASAITKIINLALKVSGLKFLKRVRDNFAIVLSFICQPEKRHLSWFNVIFSYFRKMPRSVQEEMLSIMAVNVPSEDALKIVLKVQENLVVRPWHRDAFEPLIQMLIFVSISRCPIRQVPSLPLGELLTLSNSVRSFEHPGTLYVFIAMTIPRLTALIPELQARNLLGLEFVRADLLIALFNQLSMDADMHVTSTIMIYEWIIYLWPSALAKVEFILIWAAQLPSPVSVNVLKWLPIVVKTCIQLGLSKTNPLDQIASEQFLQPFMKRKTFWVSWELDFNNFVKDVDMLIYLLQDDEIEPNPTEMPGEFGTEEEISEFLNEKFFCIVSKTVDGQLLEFPRSILVPLDPESEEDAHLFELEHWLPQQISVKAVPADTDLASEDMAEDNWDLVSDNLSPLFASPPTSTLHAYPALGEASDHQGQNSLATPDAFRRAHRMRFRFPNKAVPWTPRDLGIVIPELPRFGPQKAKDKQKDAAETADSPPQEEAPESSDADQQSSPKPSNQDYDSAPEEEAMCLHFVDRVFLSSANGSLLPPVCADAAQRTYPDMEKLFQRVEQQLEGQNHSDHGETFIKETFVVEFSTLILSNEPIAEGSKLAWFSMLRAALLFLVPTTDKDFEPRQVRRILLEGSKHLQLEDDLQSSLLLALDPNVQHFNLLINRALLSEESSQIFKLRNSLPKCSLEVAVATLKTLNVAIYVSNLSFLKKVRDNLAASLPFIVQTDERHLLWLMVMFAAYRQASESAQEAMLQNMQRSLHGLYAEKILVELDGKLEKLQVDTALHGLAKQLLAMVGTCAIINRPVSQMGSLPLPVLLALVVDPEKDACPSWPVNSTLLPYRLFALIPHLVANNFFGLNLQPALQRALFRRLLVLPTPRVRLMALEWAIYLSPSALAKAELALCWAKESFSPPIAAANLLSILPAIIKTCQRLGLTKTTGLDPASQEVADRYLLEFAHYWHQSPAEFLCSVQKLIQDKLGQCAIDLPKIKEDMPQDFQTEKEICKFLDGMFFTHVSLVNDQQQEFPRSLVVPLDITQANEHLFGVFDPPAPQLEVIAVPTGTALASEDFPLADADCDLVSDTLSPLLQPSSPPQEERVQEAAENNPEEAEQKSPAEDDDEEEEWLDARDETTHSDSDASDHHQESEAEDNQTSDDSFEAAEGESGPETVDQLPVPTGTALASDDLPSADVFSDALTPLLEPSTPPQAEEDDEEEGPVILALDSPVPDEDTVEDSQDAESRLVVPETEDEEEDEEKERPHSDHAEEQPELDNASALETDEKVDGLDSGEEASQGDAPEEEDQAAIDQEKTPAKVAAPPAAAPPKPRKRSAEPEEPEDDAPTEVFRVVTRNRAKVNKIELLSLYEPPKRARKRPSDPTADPKVIKEGPKNKRGRKTKVRPVSQAPRALQANGQPMERRKRKNWQPDPDDILPGDRLSNKRHAFDEATQAIGFCLGQGANMALYHRH
ncbi:uncharacterized protein LOC132196073 isoform X2 [Neocloeon triangulifer]|nr:uncharacterized protein LOC132196073 isoform X2 [Neocloeon triangulifer]